MLEDKRKVLVRRANNDAIEKVRKIIEKLEGRENPAKADKEYVCFEFFGTMDDGRECMKAGASCVL